MASRQKPPREPERPDLSNDQKRRCIGRLRKRIAELEAFNPAEVTKRFNDPQVKALEAGIDEVLVAAFGHNTPDYRRYARAKHLDHGPVVMGGGVDLIGARMGYGEHVRDEVADARRYLLEGKAEALALLNRAVVCLEEEIGDERDDPTPEMSRGENGMSVRHGTQRVCLNGHQRSTDIDYEPEEPHCQECGDRTITACEHCQAPIRGFAHVDGVIQLHDDTTVPKFCWKCGKPYSWTDRKIQAAIDILAESDSATESDHQTLRGALVAISADTPKTDVGVIRLKKIAAKIGKPLGDAIYKIGVDIATDAAKKLLLGS